MPVARSCWSGVVVFTGAVAWVKRSLPVQAVLARRACFVTGGMGASSSESPKITFQDRKKIMNVGYYVPSSITGGPKLRRKGKVFVGDLGGPWLRK